MPQGKGTYGSKVGRPPKKDKYQDGGSIDPFSAKNPEGIIAEKAMEALEEQNDIPTVNAQDRSQVSPMGAEVGTGVYKKGGRVSKSEKYEALHLDPKIKKEAIKAGWDESMATNIAVKAIKPLQKHKSKYEKDFDVTDVVKTMKKAKTPRKKKK